MLEAIELAEAEIVDDDASDENVSDEDTSDKETSDDEEEVKGADETSGKGFEPVSVGGVEVPPPEPPPPQPCNTASNAAAKTILNANKPLTD